MKSENILPKDTDSIEVNSVIFTFQEINAVVEDFYKRVAIDPVLEKPFQSVEDWPRHVKHLTRFWWIRFGGTPYLSVSYNPPEKHFFAGFNQDLLARWLCLFQDTLENTLSPEKANLWSIIADRMGKALSIKNEIFRMEYEAAHAHSGKVPDGSRDGKD